MSISPYSLSHFPSHTKTEIDAEIALLKMGTVEWTKRNVNYISGCCHNCIYCYAKGNACRFKRSTCVTWKNMRINWSIVKKTWRKVKKYGNQPYDIMLPTSHDILPDYWQPEDCITPILPAEQYQYLTAGIQLLKNILRPRNTVLITLKPHKSVVQTICEECDEWRDQIAFRFTIGSTNSKILKMFEPNAPTFEERMESLKYATNHGFETTISAEPLLDTDPSELIHTLDPHLSRIHYNKDQGTIWLGLLKSKYISQEERTPEVTAFLRNYKTKLGSFPYLYNVYERYFHHPRIKFKESIMRVMLRHNIRQKTF